MIDDPTKERFFESDIPPCLLTLDPLVPQNLLSFAKELLVNE